MSSEYFPAEKNGKWGLIDQKGQEILAIEYAEIEKVDKNHFWIKNHDNYWDVFFAPLKTWRNYSSIKEFRLIHEGMAVFSYNSDIENQRWGILSIIDSSVFVEPQYYWISDFKAGRAWAINSLGKVFLVDTFGATKFTQKEIVSIDSQVNAGNSAFPYRYLNLSREGLYTFKNGLGRWGAIDGEGVEKIPFKYDYLAPMNEGLVAAVSSNKLGYIDENGIAKIPFEYENPFDDDLGIISFFFENINSSFCEGYVFVKKNGLSGFIDALGNQIGEFSDYQLTHSFKDGNAIIEGELGYGLINNKGDFILKPAFKEILYNYETQKVIGIKENNGSILKDCINNKMVLKSENELRFVDSELLAFYKDEKWGLKNFDGDVLCKPCFTNFHYFSEGYLAVEIDEKWGYLNKSGKIVLNPIYDRCHSFVNDIAFVEFATEPELIGNVYYSNPFDVIIINKSGASVSRNSFRTIDKNNEKNPFIWIY